MSYICPVKTIRLTIEPLLLNQAIINLLENALKFTPEKGRVVVSVFKKQNSAHISVVDSGKGILPEQRDKIFEKYFQVKDCDGKKYSSVGLGLAIAKKVAEIHNGKITLDSTPQKGSNFTIILPL